MNTLFNGTDFVKELTKSMGREIVKYLIKS